MCVLSPPKKWFFLSNCAYKIEHFFDFFIKKLKKYNWLSGIKNQNVKKMQCIISTIWVKKRTHWLLWPITYCVFKIVNWFDPNCLPINFLGIFGVKTHWIIGQKSQNRGRYADEFWEKITLFVRKVNKVPCILGAIWGKINFLGIFGVKKHWIIGQKSQNSARYAVAFWVKNHFFWEKVNKVPCIIGAMYCCRNTLDYWAKKSK